MRKKFQLPGIMAMVIIGHTIMAQTVSINADGNPGHPSTILDISSNNRGILIPRMTSAQKETIPLPVQGVLVFCLDCNPAGLFQYTGSTWQRATGIKLEDLDTDTYVTVEKLPDDDKIRFFTNNSERMTIGNTGMVGIGNSTPLFPLTISGESERLIHLDCSENNSSSTYGIFVNQNGTGTGARYGFYLTNNNSNDDDHHGVALEMSGSGSGNHMSNYTVLSGSGSGGQFAHYSANINSGNGSHYGSYYTLSGSGTGSHFGYHSILSGSGTGSQTGNKNFISNSGNGVHTGTNNVLTGSGTGAHYGVKNEFSGIGSGNVFGTANVLSGTGTGHQYATHNTISNSSNGVHYAAYHILSGAGSGNHCGTFNNITGNGTGIQYGTYNYVDNSGPQYHLGVLNYLNGSGAGEHTGTKNECAGDGTGIQYGTLNIVSNSGNNIHYGTTNSLWGTGGGTHYGSRNLMTASGTGQKFAIYASTTGASGNTKYAGYFDGNVTVTGTFSNPSDQKLKTNIRPVSRSSSLDKVKNIHIYQYEYDREHFPFISFPEETQTGVIAQELEELFPDLVHQNVHPEYVPVNADDPRPASPEVEYLGVNVIGLIPHLISAIQAQQVLIEQLQQTVSELKAKK